MARCLELLVMFKWLGCELDGRLGLWAGGRAEEQVEKVEVWQDSGWWGGRRELVVEDSKEYLWV